VRICLDPGHGGADRANRGPTGYVEADGVLDIARRLRTVLLARGIEVVMTRDADTTVSLSRRVAIAREQQADYLISIHTDAFSSPAAHGYTVFCSAHSQRSRELAEQIELAMRATQRHSRGVRTRTLPDGRDYYHMIREASMPSVLVECGFHTNPEEEALLKTPEFRQLLAESVGNGVFAVADVTPDTVPIYLDNTLLPLPGRLWEGRTYAPVRSLSEALGLSVEWDAEQREVHLKSQRPPEGS
jgi:N-acetylmuramoyl-L-alanine amidase